jgi:hypothetical protein
MGYDDDLTAATPADVTVEPPAAAAWWGEHVMGKVTKVPVVLMHDGVPVTRGTLLTFTGEGDGRVVEVVDEVPDGAGNVVVRETYRVGADQLGCQVRPAKVVLRMTHREIETVIRHCRGLPATAALVVRDLTEVIVTGE